MYLKSKNGYCFWLLVEDLSEEVPKEIELTGLQSHVVNDSQMARSCRRKAVFILRAMIAGLGSSFHLLN